VHSTEQLATALAGRYHIERALGAGGMATVYLAQDLKHDRKVAIKVLKPELAAVLGAERFVVEIKTTASLQHPHILPLFDSGEADGFLYYVMPYIEGETVRDKLNRETQFSLEEAVRITTEVADALDYAHRHGVIHRDIKPENILLHDGRPIVADFGIALAVSAAAGGRMTESGLSLGTPHYMSPEQATAEKTLTARSDVYSLASVLYEMLTGEPPHTGASAQQVIMKIIAEPAPPVTALRKSVPPHIAAALAKALERLPADRFESAKAFSDALRNAHSTAVVVAAEGLTTKKRRWRLVAGIAAACVLVLVGAAGSRLLLGDASTGARSVTLIQRTFVRKPIYNARWAADAKTILYTELDPITGVPRVRIIRDEYPEPQSFGPDSAHLLAVSSKNEIALLLHPHPLGQRLYRGTLAKMSIGGGAPREIVDNVQEADWSPDGSQLAITRNAGDHDQIEYPVGTVFYKSPSPSYVSDLRVSPDGRHIAFFLHPTAWYDARGFVEIVDAKGAVTQEAEEYDDLEGLAWAADGRSVLFTGSRGGSQYEVRRWRSGQKTENALPNAGRLTMYDVRGGRWLVSRDDTPQLVVAHPPGASGVREISWMDQSEYPTISADGQLVTLNDQGAQSGPLYGVIMRGSDGSPAVRLGDGNPFAISPDKKWVFAWLLTSPIQRRLYPTGPGPFRPVSWPTLENVIDLALVFGLDSKSLYVCGNEPKRAARCYRSALDGGAVTPLTPDSVVGLVRPDGKAVAANRDGKWWVYPTDGGPRREIPGLSQDPLRWSPDGAALWVLRDGPPRQRRVDRVDVLSGRRTTLFTIDELQGVDTPVIEHLSVADDGKSYVYAAESYYSLLFSVDGMR
jgi:serine/threonine protein kinase